MPAWTTFDMTSDIWVFNHFLSDTWVTISPSICIWHLEENLTSAGGICKQYDESCQLEQQWIWPQTSGSSTICIYILAIKSAIPNYHLRHVLLCLAITNAWTAVRHMVGSQNAEVNFSIANYYKSRHWLSDIWVTILLYLKSVMKPFFSRRYL